LGDQIRLKNVESGRLISGVITGLNEARALWDLFRKKNNT
jgi:flagella basal body P-ring formation protein FlgA